MNTRYTCFSLKDLHPWEWEQSNSLSGVAIDLNGLCYCPLQSLKIPKLPIPGKCYGIMIPQHNCGCINCVQWNHDFLIHLHNRIVILLYTIFISLVMLQNRDSVVHLGVRKKCRCEAKIMIPLCNGVKRWQYNENVISIVQWNHIFIALSSFNPLTQQNHDFTMWPKISHNEIMILLCNKFCYTLESRFFCDITEQHNEIVILLCYIMHYTMKFFILFCN